MLVKATVILDVQDVRTWEEAFEAVFSFPGYCMSSYPKHQHRSAYFRKIIQVEGVQNTERERS